VKADTDLAQAHARLQVASARLKRGVATLAAAHPALWERGRDIDGQLEELLAEITKQREEE
jgi:hypothetical protein